MATTHPPNINHRRIMDLSPKVTEICLLDIGASKKDVVMSETGPSLFWASDVVLDKTPSSKTHNEYSEILLEVPAFW
jgi:hypothetical protein